MLYDDEFILALPEEIDEAILAALSVIMGKVDRTGSDILEARDLVIAIYESRELSNPSINKVETRSEYAFQQLQSLYSESLSSVVAKKSGNQQERFVALVGKRFCYEFTDADVKRIQSLINELRSLIMDAKDFEEDHKRRILKRLEALQGEIHRRLSNIDRFYGLIGDAGVVVGKFGADAKPFVDRVREILEIVWRSQATAEKLPASARPALLTSDKERSPEEIE
jgi:Fe-S-cluster formation regulator IscX/YfhJ